MGAHAALSRGFNSRLRELAGISAQDFEVLRRLAASPDGRMRRTDLAEAVSLTPSGITRLLAGLQEAGLVCAERCSRDGRVSYAAITDGGRRLLLGASGVHLAEIEALFRERFSQEEIAALAELLGRLPGAHEAEASCPGHEAISPTR